jgi:hypothetical protein
MKIDAKVRQFRQPTRHSIYDATAPRQQPDISTPLKGALIAFEESIRSSSIEIGAFFESKGKELIRGSGLPDQLDFSDVPDELMRGMYFSHNHPSGGNFSDADLRTAAVLALAELRVVTRDFRFSLSPTTSGWPNPANIDRALLELAPQAQRRAQLSMASGQVDRRFAQAQVEHELMSLLAERFGLLYSRQRS